MTDANLQLGRLRPEHFPHIFGPTEDQPLDAAATAAAFERLRATVNATDGQAQVCRVPSAPPPHPRARPTARPPLNPRLNRSRARPSAQMSADEVAYGFIKVANEAMCRPIRVLTQARGFDTKTHVLSCFGGAGAQHGGDS